MSTSNKDPKNKAPIEQTSSPKSAVKTDGVFVYIGPSIRGVIQNGSIYRGSKSEVLKKLAPAVEKYPKIANLVIKDADLADAREKITKGGNSLSVSYKALLSAE